MRFTYCLSVFGQNHPEAQGKVCQDSQYPIRFQVSSVVIINSKNIGKYALFSYRVQYDVIEFSNCHTEE